MTAEELTAEGARIQEVMRGLEPKGPLRRYAPELRERIVQYLEAGAATGARRDDLAVAAGVPAKTVARWMRRRRSEGVRRIAIGAQLVRVSIAAQQSNPGLSVVTPTGIRLEGLDIDTAVRVLRALG